MWLKLVAALGLSLPLLALAAWECWEWHQVVVAAPDEARLPAQQTLVDEGKARQQKLESLVDFPAGDLNQLRYLCVVGIDDKPEGETSKPFAPLAAALAEHHKEVKDALQFRGDWLAVEEGRKDKFECANASYNQLLAAHLKELTPLRERFARWNAQYAQERTQARKALDAREVTQFKTLRNNLAAQVRKLDEDDAEARRLTGLHRQRQRARAEADSYGKLLLLSEAAVRLSKSDPGAAGETLALLSEFNAAAPPRSNGDDPRLQAVLELLRLHATLVDKFAAEKDQVFVNLVRDQVQAFAEGYLVRDMEDDGMILFAPLGQVFNARWNPVARGEVVVYWKIEGKKPVDLVASEYRETFPTEEERKKKISYYGLKDKLDQGQDIAVRPRNEAARYYSAKRPQKPHTVEKLEAFLTGCPVRWPNDKKEARPEEFERVEQLLAGFKKYRVLVPPSPEGKP